MDLRIADRTIWIASPAPEVSRELACVALEEGARVAIFSTAAARAVRSLRARFGLQVLACAPSPASEDYGWPLQTAIQWGGPPEGLILHAPGPSPLAAQDGELQIFCDQLAAGGSVVVLRESRDADADDADLTRIFEGDFDVAGTFITEPARISMIGCLPQSAAPSAASRIASRLAEPGCAALAIFLIGRGAPQLTVIGRDGLIHAASGGS